MIDLNNTGFYNTRKRLEKLDPEGAEFFKLDAATKTQMAQSSVDHEQRIKNLEEALQGIPFVPSSTV